MITNRFCLLVALVLIVTAACGIKSQPKPPIGGIPAEVGRFEARPRENAILLSWKAPKLKPESVYTQAVAFQIQRRQKKAGSEVWGEFEVVGTAELPAEDGTVEWGDENIEPGIEYQYQVAAIDADGDRGKYSKPVTTRWDRPPGAPLNIEAESGDRSVTLKWEPPPEGPEIEGYFIYRADGTETLKLISQMAIQDTGYFDAGLKNGTTYRYAVRASRVAGTFIVEGPASEVVQAVPGDKTAPQVPLGVGAFVIPEGVKVIWWPNMEEDLAGYHIYRTYRGNTERITDSPFEGSTYLDTAAAQKGSYNYTVTAIDDDGNESPHSEAARVFVK